MANETRSMGKFETVRDCYLSIPADNLDVTFVIYKKIPIYSDEEVAEVTISDFWLQSGKKDILAFLEDLKRRNPIRIRQRTGGSEEEKSERVMAPDGRREIDKNGS